MIERKFPDPAANRFTHAKFYPVPKLFHVTSLTARSPSFVQSTKLGVQAQLTRQDWRSHNGDGSQEDQMKDSLKAGIEKTGRIVVDKARTIDFMGDECRV